MTVLFLGAWFLALVGLPFYLAHLRRVLRRIWAGSKVRGVLMVLAVPAVFALLMSPTLIY